MEDHPFPDDTLPPLARKGRGAASNPGGRFESQQHTPTDDGWWREEEAAPRTTLLIDTAKSVISRNDSPDLPFTQSINPYRGCEHGCVYCFARPSHAYLGFSPGLDFETRIAHKPDAAARLREELARTGYVCSPIALGINTDGWQPVERKLGISRALLEVLAECRHPVSIVTKSALILRDLDLLADLASDKLVRVMVSITTLDGRLARTLEPRAATPLRRLQVVEQLARAGVPVGVLTAPLIPALNDYEIERILEASAAAGARSAGYILLRLPHELREMFREWLELHMPDRAAHVMSLLRQMHGGKEYDARFGQRMRGSGAFAELLAGRFRLACQRLGLNQGEGKLDCARFVPPKPSLRASPQLELF